MKQAAPRSPYPLASLALAFLLTASSLGAQPRQQPPVFTETVDVRVVNLEVVVEDRQGRRVTGLGPEELRLWVDGQEVPIDFFSEIEDGRAVEEAVDYIGVYPPGVEPGQAVGTSYLVFVDELFTIGRDRNRALEGIAQEISRLGPADRMAIVAFDGRKLEMLSNWSQSGADLQDVLQAARKRPARGLMTDRIVFAGATTTQAAVDILERRLDQVSLAATAALRTFANPPGRKVMLLVAGNWPLSPTRYVLESYSAYDDRQGERLLDAIHETANLVGYTLYPIDTRGIEFHGPDASQARRNRQADTFAREDEVHDAFRKLARATGGEPLLDSARTVPLERVIADTRSYYWLGFTPTWQGNDERHSIDVQVLRPGLRARHRAGFQDFSRQREVSFRVESALLLGNMPGAEPLEVTFGKPERKMRMVRVPVEVAFPLDGVTVLPQGNRFITQLELRVVSMDEEGRRSELDLIPIVLEGTRPPQPGQMGRQQVTLELRKDQQDVVLSLHDPLSGALFTSVETYPPAGR